MIEQLHNEIVKQIVPPEYKYTARVSPDNVSFSIDKSIDKSHIDVTDPIVKILVDDCISVQINKEANKCYIVPYAGEHKGLVMDRIGKYFLWFLEYHMKQKNPTVTKLYKWVQRYTGQHSAPTGSDEEYLMLFRYLNTNLNMNELDSINKAVHIKNGIAILNTFKTKYEARGCKLEVTHGRRRRRRW